MSVLKEINKYRLKHDKNEHKLSESRQLQEQRQRVRSNKAECQCYGNDVEKDHRMWRTSRESSLIVKLRRR